MALDFRIEVPAPATSSTSSKSFVWTAQSEIVESIDVELHTEHKHISMLNVRLSDRRQGNIYFPLYNSLPDPAFADVPVKVSLTNPNGGPSSLTTVFDGKVTSLQAGYPGPTHTSIVAHDKSISARLQARYKAYRGKTSVQIAQQIAQDYGYTVDVSSLTGLVLTQRAIDIGMSTMGIGAFSDWNHLVRALAVDGLELYVKGTTLHVRQSATLQYPTVFTPDDGNVISFEVQTQHVRGPGAGGQSKTPMPGGSKGSTLSATGAIAQEAAKEGSTAVTHRTPPQGAKQGFSGAHTESSRSLTAWAGQRRKRKDEATLTLRLTPDIGMQHLIAIKGWGQKIDGTWYIANIHHSLAGQSGTTTLHLTSAPTSGAQKQAGIVQPGGTTTTVQSDGSTVTIPKVKS
jgi:phage protein D